MSKNCALVICSDCIFGITIRTVSNKGVYFTPSPYRKTVAPTNHKSLHLRRPVSIRK